MSECQLTHLARSPIDVRRAAEPELPDSVFVEDAAVVFDELAILARPGAESRRPEVASIAKALEPHRKAARVEPPGTLDGGDVLTVGQRVFVGLSQRTSQGGIEQMRALLEPHGYSVESVPVERCLHLKSAVTQAGEGRLLINPAWIERDAFPGFDLIEVDPAEPFAANALLVDGTVIYPAAYPRTRRRLEERGIRVAQVEVSELAKAEGGVTCCSLILKR